MKSNLPHLLTVGFAAAVLAIGLAGLGAYRHIEQDRQQLVWAAAANQAQGDAKAAVRWRVAEAEAARGRQGTIILFPAILLLLATCYGLALRLIRFAGSLEARVRQRTEELEASVLARKQLEAEVLGISDHEQRRLGQELHDGIGQQLTAIELMLFQAAGWSGDAAHLDQIGRHVRDVIGDVRRLARGLAPFIVDADGLHAGLAGLAEAAPVPCELTYVAPAKPVTSEQALHLYRIAQEAFNNALKHARATKISIRFEPAIAGLTLQVADNGRGMAEAPKCGKGLGLQIMHYRAALMRAALVVESPEGGGVSVTCTVPA